MWSWSIARKSDPKSRMNCSSLHWQTCSALRFASRRLTPLKSMKRRSERNGLRLTSWLEAYRLSKRSRKSSQIWVNSFLPSRIAMQSWLESSVQWLLVTLPLVQPFITEAIHLILWQKQVARRVNNGPVSKTWPKLHTLKYHRSCLWHSLTTKIRLMEAQGLKK